ncbi:PSD1 and planctomycete cytochrome C domain-containing protein [Tundrisphaera lichenicola]|uniref:PSD1 and planctomycete cytochrome C domain-containing protein n=1 Tax=Tundrisphaera lichenicola TaxID=2029860 RepID=UPI003EBAB839
MRPTIERPGLLVGWIAPAALLVAWGAGSTRAEGPDSPEALAFFESSVRPILAEQCWKCHGPDKQSGGLRLDSRASILEGGDAGPVLVPGEPDKSPILQVVRHEGDLPKMPPKGDKLTDVAVASLAKWVGMGAPWPAGPVPTSEARESAARSHWAYQPVGNPAPPAVEDSPWVASPVDAFILAKLEANKLAPSGPADKRTMIRRASYDLTGLPPTPEEVEAFVQDESPQAFARVVDRLLASPRYGERWGRHWLDVARYADTKGYVFTAERRYPYSYTYRDYVIRAFNEDKPYDQFLVEQIAADRLPLGEDKRPLAALGFLTVGRRFLNDNNEIIDDRIDVVTRGLLGMSVTCARCHDHKFDPIPTEDYYSLHGVFASSIEPEELPLLPDAAPEKDRADYERQRQERLDVAEQYRIAHKAMIEAEIRDHLRAFTEASQAIGFESKGGRKDPRLEEAARAREVSPERLRFVARRLGKLLDPKAEGHDPILAPWRSFSALPAEGFEAKAAELAKQLAEPDPSKPIDPVVLKAMVEPPPKSLAEVAARYGDLFERAAKSFAENPEIGPPLTIPDPALAPIHERLVAEESPIEIPLEALDRVLNRAEREKLQGLKKKVAELDVTHPGSPARAMVLNDAPNPTNPRVSIRGNPNRPGKEVPRRFLRVLSGGEAKPFTDGSGRLELARAIASPENPLTARVMVNRIWHEHFGVGLVSTPSDFGARGELPSHPELLDFLARRFMESGWSVKALHRLILLSNTYQQKSDLREDGFAADPINRLLWRQNRRRLDFEALRDGVLAVAGQLDPTMGGRPVELFERKSSSHRRTVYGYVDRYDLDPTYRTFDFPSPDISAPQRPTTTVPQQALFLMNSPFLLDQAKALANRPDLASKPLEDRVARLHLDLFGRGPEPREVELARQFVEACPKGDGPDAPSPWEEYAQVLLLTNEFLFLD